MIRILLFLIFFYSDEDDEHEYIGWAQTQKSQKKINRSLFVFILQKFITTLLCIARFHNILALF